jgi:hypothetical protein
MKKTHRLIPGLSLQYGHLCALQENLSIRKLQIDSLPLRPLSACFPFMGLCWTLAGRAWQVDVDAMIGS